MADNEGASAKYILEPGTILSGAAADAVAKKHHKTVDILMNFMTETVFDRFTSTSVNNKGCVWLKFMQYEYKGNLAEFIINMHKMLNKIAVCKLGVPDNILSFSILAKLSEDLYNVVDNIIMNEVICESPAATLTKLQEICQNQPKIKRRHNPAATSHDAEHCYQIHPKLRPPQFSRPYEKATTQLVEVNDGHESEPISEANIKISTGGHSNLLYATAVASAILVNQDGKKLILNNVLLVPSLTRSLISIPRIVMVEVNNKFCIQGSIKNNLLEIFNCSFLVIKSPYSCYHSSPIKPNWHNHLGHPNPVYQKALVPESEVVVMIL
ncbi:uncharacterized protein VP01_3383g2 [Puccinia sorghi]|uniref:Uncharacterized protein n=1 Tax=Puccinia sorghi TaxID=27349 RepID=A0A0L6UWR1_9BASI|nr:uncharacterized protein VP01_3383g2 [Puccinia sorghi]